MSIKHIVEAINKGYYGIARDHIRYHESLSDRDLGDIKLLLISHADDLSYKYRGRLEERSTYRLFANLWNVINPHNQITEFPDGSSLLEASPGSAPVRQRPIRKARVRLSYDIDVANDNLFVHEVANPKNVIANWGQMNEQLAIDILVAYNEKYFGKSW